MWILWTRINLYQHSQCIQANCSTLWELGKQCFRNWAVLVQTKASLCLKVWWLASLWKRNVFLPNNKHAHLNGWYQIRSDQISRSVVSDSLQPHEWQHARPPCPSPTPRIHSDSRPLSPWCHPAISSSVVPFSSCPQSLPASESFPMSQLFAWGG